MWNNGRLTEAQTQENNVQKNAKEKHTKRKFNNERKRKFVQSKRK